MGEEVIKAEPLVEGEAAAERPAFRGEARTDAGLDLLVEMDEPEQLMRELGRIAESFPKSDRRWEGIRRLCERAHEYFEVINRPESNRPWGTL